MTGRDEGGKIAMTQAEFDAIRKMAEKERVEAHQKFADACIEADKKCKATIAEAAREMREKGEKG